MAVAADAAASAASELPSRCRCHLPDPTPPAGMTRSTVRASSLSRAWLRRAPSAADLAEHSGALVLSEYPPRSAASRSGPKLAKSTAIGLLNMNCQPKANWSPGWRLAAVTQWRVLVQCHLP